MQVNAGELTSWIGLFGTIIGFGVGFGSLQQRIKDLERWRTAREAEDKDRDVSLAKIADSLARIEERDIHRAAELKEIKSLIQRK